MCLGLPGSVRNYLYRSGSFHQQAKIKKNLDFNSFVTSLKTDLNVSAVRLLAKKLIFVGILKTADENELDPDP
jgi:hypothetical protein